MNEWLIFFSIVDRKKAAQYQFSFNDANKKKKKISEIHQNQFMCVYKKSIQLFCI